MELENLPFQPERELESVLALLRPRLQHKNCTLESHIDPRIPPTLVGDALRLRQILLNLGGNAIKFSERGTVRIDVQLLRRKQHDITLAQGLVSDEGIGMSRDEQARIFTPFSQADLIHNPPLRRHWSGPCPLPPADRTHGRAHNRAERARQGQRFQGGTALWRGSGRNIRPGQPGRRRCRGICLPARSAGAHGRRRGHKPRDYGSAAERHGRECMAVGNGQEALDVWRKQADDIDLVLMDVQMPIMDGYTATREIRASGLPGAVDVPIVAMTAYAMRGDAERSLQAGMNAHLTKPIDVRELTLTPSALPGTVKSGAKPPTKRATRIFETTPESG